MARKKIIQKVIAADGDTVKGRFYEYWGTSCSITDPNRVYVFRQRIGNRNPRAVKLYGSGYKNTKSK